MEEPEFQYHALSTAFLLWYWVKPRRYFCWILPTNYIHHLHACLVRAWDVIHIKVWHTISLLAHLAHTPLLHTVLDFPKFKPRRLVTSREKPSRRISDLYKQWPQKQDSKQNYPPVSLPSVAPREPPQFLSTSSECKRTVGRLCLSLCIRFLHQSAKEGPITICPDYVCELGVLFGGMIRRTPGCERRGQQHPPAVHPFTTEGSSGGGHGCGQGGKQPGEDLCNPVRLNLPQSAASL